MSAIFGVLHAQMFFEHVICEGKKVWRVCNNYIQKNIVVREKIFSNGHILECTAISYDLNGEYINRKPFKFTQSMIDDDATIRNNGIIVTEIKFDNFDCVKLTSGYDALYSMKTMYETINEQFAGGYPSEVSPFMCVDIRYDDNKYDVTGLLREYLYKGNTILTSKFIRMFMFEHFCVNIKKNDTFSLHIVDKDVNISEIRFDGHDDYVYEV
jgi:hypothetical protein